MGKVSHANHRQTRPCNCAGREEKLQDQMRVGYNHPIRNARLDIFTAQYVM